MDYAPDGVLKWQDSAGNAYTMPLEFWFEANSAGKPCCYANFSLPEDVSGPTEGFLFWEATPTFPEIVSLYNFSVTAAQSAAAGSTPTPCRLNCWPPASTHLAGSGGCTSGPPRANWPRRGNMIPENIESGVTLR